MSEKTARLDKSVIDMVYPVGAIYMSVNGTNPGNLFGGKWEQIKDRFLLACGDTYAAGSTGGEARHTLTVEEMPNHVHGINDFHVEGQSEGHLVERDNEALAGQPRATQGKYYWYGSTLGTGDSQPHNNMPPYLAVYIWKRTA